ncbi:hypothetical protein KXQ82_10495 [Mucilaginibacter sp. HMF5004]|uniref:hypothetical protein n=1 Tax=Mucilaginibacter rivuli TaxID=2857527 RepID=UPI001C5EB52D|nr:hypothetical protein [Mucilaginibacter rivuli]MBW4890148.1 hypothetical protein [Mucilaginibacter rivuli]
MRKAILISSIILLFGFKSSAQQQPDGSRKKMPLSYKYYQHMLQTDSSTAAKVLQIMETYQQGLKNIYLENNTNGHLQNKRHDELDSLRIASLKVILTPEQLRPFNIRPSNVGAARPQLPRLGNAPVPANP